MSLERDIDRLLSALGRQAERAVQCLTFWLMLGGLYLLYDSRIDDISRDRKSEQAEILDAKKRLATFPSYATNVCHDGSTTTSDGSGACSWHGGVKESVAYVKSLASSDANDRFNRQKASVDKLYMFLAFIVFLIAPALHESWFGKQEPDEA